MAHGECTLYTVTDSGYFVGTVALLNSLRLTGNAYPLVVLDRGLTPDQRRLLEPHVEFAELPEGDEVSPRLLKAFPAHLDATGIVGLIDSDMLVCGPLAGAFETAAADKIYAVQDDPVEPWRCFGEWEPILGLSCAPRADETYVNAGFVAFSVSTFPTLLDRWSNCCSRIPDSLLDRPGPFEKADQDVLNALLRTEFAAEVLSAAPYHIAPMADAGAVVLDRTTLESSFDGERCSILHYIYRPKPWQRAGWSRDLRAAYCQLLPRVLCADDVVVKLEPDSLPFWLREDSRGSVARWLLPAARNGVRGALWAVPKEHRHRLTTRAKRLGPRR